MKVYAYATLTKSQLDRVLNERVMQGKMTNEERIAAYKAHDELVEVRLTDSAKQGAARRYWTPLMQQLSAEIRNAEHSLARFKKLGNSPAEVAAYDAYLDVLRPLHSRMYSMIREGIPPGELCKMLREAGKREISNEGKWWTDWVSPKDKAFVRALFNAIPYRLRAKRKEPFVSGAKWLGVENGETVSPN